MGIKLDKPFKLRGSLTTHARIRNTQTSAGNLIIDLYADCDTAKADTGFQDALGTIQVPMSLVNWTKENISTQLSQVLNEVTSSKDIQKAVQYLEITSLPETTTITVSPKIKDIPNPTLAILKGTKE